MAEADELAISSQIQIETHHIKKKLTYILLINYSLSAITRPPPRKQTKATL